MKQKQIKYSESLKLLEEIINDLEDSNLSIDELTLMVKKANSIIKECRIKLHDIQKELDDSLEKE